MASSEEAATLPARAAPTRGNSIADVLAALVTLAGLVFTGLAIRRELSHPVRVAAPRASFATLARADGAVKVRDADSLVWDLAAGGEALARGDAVFVPPDGFAEVRFDDGSTLSVEATSLVVLDAREDDASRPSVRLRQGGLTARLATTGLTVVTSDARAELSASAQASVSVSAEGARLEVTEGAAVVRGAGASSEVRAGSAVETSGRGVRRVESAGVLLMPGPSARRYFAGPAASVRFEWEAPDADVVLELADDRAFTRLLSSRTAQGRSVIVTNLAPGAYFWRVRGASGTWTTQPRALLLVRDRPPDPISPTRGQVLYLPGASVATFRWSEVSGAHRYQVQIGDESTFAHPRLDGSVERAELRLGPFAPEGVYLWRVRAVDPERGQSPWADPVRFRLVIEPLPAPPELYDPELDLAAPRVPAPLPPRPGRLEGAPAPAGRGAPPPPTLGPQGWLWRLVGGVALAAEASPPEPPAAAAPELSVLLRWSSVPGVSQYVLEVAEDPEFTRVALRQRVTEPWYRWRTASRRPHWWRVQSIDAKGREGAFSAPRQLAAVLAAPVLLAPLDTATVSIGASMPVISLEWQPERLAYGYVVEIATDPEAGHVIHRESVTEPGARFVPPGPGVYHWRVRALDGAGGEEESKPRRLAVALGAPVPTAVAPRVLRSGEALVLSASSIAGAEAYELEIASAGDFAVPLLHELRPAPSLTWVPPGAGRWLWRARAVGATAVSPWSPAAELVALLPAPVVRAPRAAEDLASRVPELPVRVELEVVPGAEGYRLELFAVDDERAVLSATVTSSAWTSPPIAAGAWTLVASALAGGTVSEPTRVAFVRTQVPPLPAPALTSPGAAARIVFWASPPPVVFAWQAVPDATAYELDLDPPDDASTAAPRAPPLLVRVPTYELAGLAAGAHGWRVRAVDAADVPGPWSEARHLSLEAARGGVAALTVDPGPVPVGRVEPAHVRLELHDADGAPVVGELRAQALHGSLGVLTAVAAGVFVADYLAPAEGRLAYDELSLERAGDAAALMARVPLLPSARLRVGVSGGVVSNFASPVAPTVALDGDYRVARVLGELSATVRVGYHRKQLSAAGALDASAVQHTVPATLGARLALLRGPVVPYVGAGVVAALLVSTVRVEGQTADERTAWGLGFEGAAGCELAGIGPGSAFGEARWGRLRAASGDVAYDGGGLAVAVGYRLDLW
jgi:hypothetical protein